MHSSNVEFVAELMQYSAHGPLIQAFVMHALSYYAQRVAAMSPQELETSMVSGYAWHGCALEIRDKLAKRLGQPDPLSSTTSGQKS